jgi:hypothetical protein
VTRGPTLAWLPAVWWVLRRKLQLDSDIPPRPALLLASASCLLIVALVPIRNYVVSGHPALTATNAGATLQLAHPLTPSVDLRGVDRTPIYRALRLEDPVVQTLEFIRQDPLGYLATLVPLALYSLGFPSMLEPENPTRWELVGLVLLYALALRQSDARQPYAWLLHSFIGLHFTMMLIFLPNNYGYRQVLPMYLFLAVFAGRQLERFWLRLTERTARKGAVDKSSRVDAYAVKEYVPKAGPTAGYEKLT